MNNGRDTGDASLKFTGNLIEGGIKGIGIAGEFVIKQVTRHVDVKVVAKAGIRNVGERPDAYVGLSVSIRSGGTVSPEPPKYPPLSPPRVPVPDEPKTPPFRKLYERFKRLGKKWLDPKTWLKAALDKRISVPLNEDIPPWEPPPPIGPERKKRVKIKVRDVVKGIALILGIEDEPCVSKITRL